MNQLTNPGELKAFENNVVQIITQLESVWTGEEKWDQKGYGAVTGSDQPIEQIINQVYNDGIKNNIAPKEEFRQAAIEAKTALEYKPNHPEFCRVLKSISKDSYDVAKLIIPSILPLSLTGAIAVPAIPLVIGIMSFALARVGISIFCGDELKESSS